MYCAISVGGSRSLGGLPAPSSIASVAITGTTSSQLQAGISPGTGSGSTNPVTTGPRMLGAGGDTQLPPLALGMTLSPAMAPIPHRLVQRIQAGRFMEMRELLTDNLALHDQLEAVQGLPGLVSLPAALRTCQREVTSLDSWMYCFTAYMAVRKSDDFTRRMLAYCRLIIHEAMQHGGRGWLEYDRTFRRQCEVNASLPWNSLLPDLQASTILSQPTGLFCPLCQGVDHTRQQCALASIQQPTTYQSASFPRGQRCSQGPRRASQFTPICSSWNSGSCVYPGTCTFRHVCAKCFSDHKAKDCPEEAGSPNPVSSRQTQGPPGRR